MGDWSYRVMLPCNRVKNAVQFIANFENVLAGEARRRGGDGGICGHIHHAEMRAIVDILYCNDSGWPESCTALVEHFDGQLENLRGGTLSRFKSRAAELATAS